MFSLDFIYFLLKWFDPRRFIETTTKPGLNRDRVYEQVVPVPPLPVQERIVDILQKAEQIRRKRQDALELANAVLPATFHDMFGEPETSKSLSRLGDVIKSIRNGLSRRRKVINNEGQIVLRIQDVGDGYIDYSNANRIQLLDSERLSFTLETGDMLLVRVNGNRNLVGRNSLFISTNEPIAHNDHLMRVRFDLKKVLPEYVAAYLRTPFGKHELASKVSTSAGNHTINQDGVRSIKLPIPPIKKQEKFLAAVEQHIVVRNSILDAQKESYSIFDSLLAKAFTGELTSEWEAVNAKLIAEQIEFQEELPRLILLAFLWERANRASRKLKETTILVTAMMKYAFLLQMEGNGHRRLYQFVPYHYGPFAKDLYADLEKLQKDGLVTVKNDTDEDKTRITLADSAKAKENLAALSDDLKEDISAILSSYGDLDHNALLKTVYDKYPAYTKKSRIRKAHKAPTAGKKGGRRAKK